MVENTVVEFSYVGGSTPGQKRKVFVTEVGPDDFAGYDFSRRHFRRFKTRKATNVVVDKTAKVVDVSILPSTISDITVERGLQADGYEVYTDYPFVVGIKLPAKPKLTITSNGLTFEGPNGNVEVNIANGRLSVYENGRGINQNPDDPMPVYTAIKRVLGV